LARRPEEELRKAFNGDGPERTKACLHANKEPAEETPAAANKKETNKPHTPRKDKAELTDEQPFTDTDDQTTPATNAGEGTEPATITGETQKDPNPKRCPQSHRWELEARRPNYSYTGASR
jgi:hypothetical protein